VQAFPIRQSYPEKYDLLMDIATEEFSHLEIVGATIQMLLGGVNGELKKAADSSGIMEAAAEAGVTKLVSGGKAMRDGLIHQALTANPEFCVLSGGGPTVTNAAGIPWSGSYVNANGDLTVDLRSNIAAESRAKIVYEYLMQFTEDPLVKESLSFLMTREVAHFQMFSAALASIQPNFPPGVLQGDPRYTNVYFNMSNGASVRGPWNQGSEAWNGTQEWRYVENPVEEVRATDGLTTCKPAKGAVSAEDAETLTKKLSDMRSKEVLSALPKGQNQWSAYPQTEVASPAKKKKAS
jgi:Mn-containing catalase